MVTVSQITPIPISSLPAATTLTGNEATAIVQNNQTVQSPVNQLPQGMTAGVIVYGNTGGSPFPNYRTLAAGNNVTIVDGGPQGSLTISLSGSGTGTVTSVSGTNANGIAFSIANPTTAPNITISLGAITPSTVNGLTLAAQANGFTIAGGTASKTLTVPLDASVSGTNTGDQTSVSGNAGTATALQNARTIGGVSFNGTANIVPQTIQSVSENVDTTCFPLFISASGSQSLQPLNSTALTFNAATASLGAANFAGLVNGNTITTGTGVLTISAGKTLSVSNSITLAGTDSTTQTFPTLSTNQSGILSAGNSGSTNDSSSGSGAYVNHTPSYTLPANYLTAGKVLRITAHFSFTSGSVPPTLLIELLAGATVLSVPNTASTPVASQTNKQFALQYLVQGTAAAGASANTFTGMVGNYNVTTGTGNFSDTAQPVALATNGTLTFQMATKWSAAGTGTTNITLQQFIVEALN